MITLVLTNRNRELRIIKNCLNSLAAQSVREFNVILVDYGSDFGFVDELSQLVAQYSFVKLICCPVQAQLWNKARAINIALQQCITSHFLVGDIDMLFRKDFMEKTRGILSNKEIVYLKVGFLSETESKKDTPFEDYAVKHFSTKEATGITLFPTTVLKEIHGYDEFYHGWGAEDTDVHIRLKNADYEIDFYEGENLLLHQWHPKVYRSKKSTHAFHSQLERINHAYLMQTAQSKRTKANLFQDWGKWPDTISYQQLERTPDHRFRIKAFSAEVQAVLGQLKNFNEETVEVVIEAVKIKEKLRNRIKRFLGKKYKSYYELEFINDWLLEEIIKNYRNCPYQYNFNQQEKEICLIINFQS